MQAKIPKEMKKPTMSIEALKGVNPLYKVKTDPTAHAFSGQTMGDIRPEKLDKMRAINQENYQPRTDEIQYDRLFDKLYRRTPTSAGLPKNKPLKRSKIDRKTINENIDRYEPFNAEKPITVHKRHQTSRMKLKTDYKF